MTEFLPEAVADLDRSGITGEMAERAGIYCVGSARDISTSYADVPALVIPYYDMRGEMLRVEDGTSWHRVRYLGPVHNAKGKVVRYSQLPGSGIRVYFPPMGDAWEHISKDVDTPLVITEGEKKALACTYIVGVPTIGVGGVWNWRERGGLCSQLAAINWDSRHVTLAFDSDAAENGHIRLAEDRLCTVLTELGATVHLLRLKGSGGRKRAIDDVIVEDGPDTLFGLLSDAPEVHRIKKDVARFNSQIVWVDNMGCVVELDPLIAEGDIRTISPSAMRSGSRYSADRVQVIDAKGNPKQVQLASQWLTHPDAFRVSELTFDPDTDDRIITTGSVTRLNYYAPLVGTRGPVTPFLDLNAHILDRTEPSAAEDFLNLIAWKMQNPGRLTNITHILASNEEGTGKGLWASSIRSAFGRYGRSVSAYVVENKFNDWVRGCLLAHVDEVQGINDKRARAALRSIIADPKIMLEAKREKAVESRNFVQLVATTNDLQFVTDAQDRRFFVVQTPPPAEPRLYNRVGQWLQEGGASHLTRWLLEKDLTQWERPTRAPLTTAKWAAVHDSMDEVQMLAHKAISGQRKSVEDFVLQAAKWARTVSVSPDASLAAWGQTCLQALRHWPIRPIYSLRELSFMVPAWCWSFLANTPSRQTSSLPHLSRGLRAAGVPLLVNTDNPQGFVKDGVTDQYFVLWDREKLARPISQERFEEIMRSAEYIALED